MESVFANDLRYFALKKSLSDLRFSIIVNDFLNKPLQISNLTAEDFTILKLIAPIRIHVDLNSQFSSQFPDNAIYANMDFQFKFDENTF